MNSILELELSDDDHDLFGSCTTSKQQLQATAATPAADELDLILHACSKTTTTAATTKKLNHNAYERDQRKKMNELYSSLQSLLPQTDQNKKLSIPCSISQVIKYIPEIQRYIETLTKRKEQIHLNMKTSSRQEQQEHDQLYGCPVVSVAYLSDSEVLIHICTAKTGLILSKILRVFDNEGFQLLNASTLSISGDKTIYSLHLIQMKKSPSMDCKLCCERIVELIKKHAN